MSFYFASKQVMFENSCMALQKLGLAIKINNKVLEHLKKMFSSSDLHFFFCCSRFYMKTITSSLSSSVRMWKDVCLFVVILLLYGKRRVRQLWPNLSSCCSCCAQGGGSPGHGDAGMQEQLHEVTDRKCPWFGLAAFC